MKDVLYYVSFHDCVTLLEKINSFQFNSNKWAFLNNNSCFMLNGSSFYYSFIIVEIDYLFLL